MSLAGYAIVAFFLSFFRTILTASGYIKTTIYVFLVLYKLLFNHIFLAKVLQEFRLAGYYLDTRPLWWYHYTKLLFTSLINFGLNNFIESHNINTRQVLENVMQQMTTYSL